MTTGKPIDIYNELNKLKYIKLERNIGTETMEYLKKINELEKNLRAFECKFYLPVLKRMFLLCDMTEETFNKIVEELHLETIDEGLPDIVFDEDFDHLRYKIKNKTYTYKLDIVPIDYDILNEPNETGINKDDMIYISLSLNIVIQRLEIFYQTMVDVSPTLRKILLNQKETDRYYLRKTIQLGTNRNNMAITFKGQDQYKIAFKLL